MVLLCTVYQLLTLVNKNEPKLDNKITWNVATDEKALMSMLAVVQHHYNLNAQFQEGLSNADLLTMVWTVVVATTDVFGHEW